jgi:hypothetical protein
MMWMMAAILLVLWVLGMVSGAAVGWWIHLFLLLALVAVTLGVTQRARPAL